jgi:hypothetical protein
MNSACRHSPLSRAISGERIFRESHAMLGSMMPDPDELQAENCGIPSG